MLNYISSKSRNTRTYAKTDLPVQETKDDNGDISDLFTVRDTKANQPMRKDLLQSLIDRNRQSLIVKIRQAAWRNNTIKRPSTPGWTTNLNEQSHWIKPNTPLRKFRQGYIVQTPKSKKKSRSFITDNV